MLRAKLDPITAIPMTPTSAVCGAVSLMRFLLDVSLPSFQAFPRGAGADGWG